MTDLHPPFIAPEQLRPDRETVVLLHSSAASARQWDALVELLRPRYDVHAIDLHGHGRQAPWAGDRPLSVHDDAALALRAIERAGAVHLIGHSYGAAVALHLAAARPSRLCSLALYEALPFRVLAEHEPQSAPAQEAFGLAGLVRGLASAGRTDDAAERFVDYWSGRSVWAHMQPERQRAIACRMPIVAQHFDALYDEPLPAERLARLTMPVLCLTGARSTAAALRIAALLRDLLPGARHETLAGLGHMGPITHAPIVNDRLLRFLDAGRHRARPQAAVFA